jgi:hypothetical protein
MVPTPSTTPSASRIEQSNSSPTYRQVNYYDGIKVCIAESRRHSHVIQSGTTSSTLVPALEPSGPQTVLGKGYDSSQATLVRDTSSARGPRPTSHVTSKSRRAKAETVIVQAPIPVKLNGSRIIPQVDIKDLPTPPPTPKIRRLPTPDLEDLEDSPFCHCCIEESFFKYCTSCGNNLRSRIC